MNKMIHIRPFAVSDADCVLRLHRAAVMITASQDYDLDVLEDWSPPIDKNRKIEFLSKAPPDIRLVAHQNGQIVGFGELVFKKNYLQACYTHPDFGRQGIGSKILSELERIAQEKGLAYLQLESSITAEKFYKNHGYSVTEYGEHTLRSGKKMACVKMKKFF
jgi:putative acetyltransferase